MSFWLVNCIFTILLPFTRPSLIISEVVIMFRISFCEVPDFMRVLPVKNSGPTMASIGMSTFCAKTLSLLFTMQPVRMPSVRALLTAPIT